MADDEEEHAALRISQLDASELDRELVQLLRSQLNSAFKYFKPGTLDWLEPEISACLRFVLWKFSVDAVEATVGQRLLSLKYRNEGSSGGTDRWMSRKQKILYAVLVIGGQWLQDRSVHISRYTALLPCAQQINRLIGWLESGWKVATLLNFLVFLQKGRYQFILERILGIRAMFPQRQALRQVGFDFMSREILWHGFAEFLFFIVPMINFRRIKNMIMRKFFPASHSALSSKRTQKEYSECAVCADWPVCPREIGCIHVFCYYCIQSNYAADPSYSCPLCGQQVDRPENITEVKVQVTVATSS